MFFLDDGGANDTLFIFCFVFFPYQSCMVGGELLLPVGCFHGSLFLYTLLIAATGTGVASWLASELLCYSGR